MHHLPPKEIHRKVPVKDQNFRVQSSPSSSGPRTSVPGEIKTSKGDSLDFIKAWTKDNLIKETPEDTSQDSNLGILLNQNPDCHRLNQKASLLAALSPAYFKAW